MAFCPSSPSPRTPHNVLERALKEPRSTIWLDRVRVTTTQFEAALAFYSGLLGLSLRTVERHPLHFDRLRAVMIDAEGRDVIEIAEAAHDASPETDAAGVSQIGFRLPRRTWRALRSRLDAHDVAYDHAGTTLLLNDPDGLLLRVEALGEA